MRLLRADGLSGERVACRQGTMTSRITRQARRLTVLHRTRTTRPRPPPGRQVAAARRVLIFGSPQAGTPFMECAQTVGIDLPLKALVWEDADGQVWLGYNDPAYLGQRHGAGQCPAIGNITKALGGLVEAATTK